MSDSLPQEMREAADVLDVANDRNKLLPDTPWSPLQLREYADKWEAEDNVAAEREAMAEELARNVLSAFGVFWSLDILAERDKWLQMTRKLIAAGWTKQVRS